jgi:hypothetical protein
MDWVGWAFLLVVLVAIMAAVLRYARGGGRRAAFNRAAGAVSPPRPTPQETAGSPGDDPARTFPFRRRALPPLQHMFTDLRNERPRRRKNYKGTAWTLMRDPGDDLRVDRIADYYTEELRVLQVPPGCRHLPSLWDCWHRQCDREQAYATASDPTSILSLRDKLEEFAPAVHDTNPVFACHILRRAARRMRKETYNLRVLDGDAGWGGQALAACAADVGCYHGYLPGDGPSRSYQADCLKKLLEERSPPGAPGNDFWVRQMSVLELGEIADPYDLAFLHSNDLRALAPASAGGNDVDAFIGAPEVPFISRFLRPGGLVVLFIPPGRHGADRAQAALHLVQTWDAPAIVEVAAAPHAPKERASGSRPQSLGRALVWAKFEQTQP